jgi:excisionase family DNA binding protein
MGAAEKLDDEIVTAKIAAERLHLNIKTIYEMAHKKQLPGARWFRGTLRIHWPTVVVWMAQSGAAKP